MNQYWVKWFKLGRIDPVDQNSYNPVNWIGGKFIQVTRSQLIKIKQYGAKSREITPYQPKWHEVNQNCGNQKFLKIIKFTLVYQNIEKWTDIVRT